MIFDVCNMRLVQAYFRCKLARSGRYKCKSLLPEPKSDYPGQLGNLIVAACLNPLFSCVAAVGNQPCAHYFHVW